jgi:hypothetical protein
MVTIFTDICAGVFATLWVLYGPQQQQAAGRKKGLALSILGFL